MLCCILVMSDSLQADFIHTHTHTHTHTYLRICVLLYTYWASLILMSKKLCQAFLYLLSHLILTIFYKIILNNYPLSSPSYKCETDRALNVIYLQSHMQKQLVLKLRASGYSVHFLNNDD